MTFSRPNINKLKITRIPDVLESLLRALPECGENLSPDAESRIYPLPTDDPALEELACDWRAHVHGGLHEEFLSARDAVRADLRAMTQDSKGESTLAIPPAHAEAWVSATTQARLALTETHGFTEEELSKPTNLPASTPRDLIRLQMDLYAAIQEWILEALD